ncbi:hypothetical protein JAAARDRAFT_399150 [Jaapia argillacea MUCL 33604]|uniref:Uncharacterized protein n=1 Tax=Jaapia argillacea MUCL 33604 TaxID=933084 RepID=A0A067PI43_9AGAM|nr:hypothetical protein JAAARDRAFT_399150 [Jaapia argillacea MUCL 33604]
MVSWRHLLRVFTGFAVIEVPLLRTIDVHSSWRSSLAMRALFATGSLCFGSTPVTILTPPAVVVIHLQPPIAKLELSSKSYSSSLP